MRINRTATGIPSLDELIEGGFPKPCAVGILGDVGSGKTIMCQQMAWGMLQAGSHVLYYCIDHGMDDVIDSMSRFGWDVQPYIDSDQLHFVDMFSRGLQVLAQKVEDQLEDITVEPDKVSKISFSLRDMISAGKKHYFRAVTGKKLLVVLDSLTPILSSVNPEDVLRFLQYMKFATRVSNAVGIATLQLGVHGEQIENAASHIADGVIELRRKTERGSVRRFLRVVKMNKTRAFEEYCPFEITGEGLVIHKIPLTSV